MSRTLPRFYCDDLASGILTESESAHAVKTMRLTVGSELELLDGKGIRLRAEIAGITNHCVQFIEIHRTHFERSGPALHIAISPPKSIDRFLFFVEKATELGITSITPLISQHSERSKLNVEKIRKTITASLKQSGNPFLPQLKDSLSFVDLVKNSRLPSARFIAHCREDGQKQALSALLQKLPELVVIIGPEGDFTQEEINLALENKFTPVSLSENVLRTETAGIAVCSIVLSTYSAL